MNAEVHIKTADITFKGHTEQKQTLERKVFVNNAVVDNRLVVSAIADSIAHVIVSVTDYRIAMVAHVLGGSAPEDDGS